MAPLINGMKKMTPNMDYPFTKLMHATMSLLHVQVLCHLFNICLVFFGLGMFDNHMLYQQVSWEAQAISLGAFEWLRLHLG